MILIDQNRFRFLWGRPTLVSLEGLNQQQTVRQTIEKFSVLPGGASCTTPCQIKNQQPFFLEAGWLIDANHRQRLMRRYDERGTWVSLTLLVEEKVGTCC